MRHTIKKIGARVHHAERSSKSPRFGAVLFLVCVSFLIPIQLFAQFDTGTITGSVTDPSGAVVPHAAITVTNVGTSVERALTSDDAGSFVASALPFGTYVVSAKASGFAEAKSQQIVLNVGSTVRVRLALALQASEQAIEVTGTLTTVDTTSSTTGTTLNSQQIANLPINGRDVNNFLSIAPGSVNSTGFFQGSVNGLDNIFTGLNITVDGQNATRGDINGFLNTQGQEAARVTRASVDSIQEINFANNGYTAETGHSLGPQMNIVTKSGTNNFHGSAFEYLRNDVFDAKDYFEEGDKSPLRLNQFGANLAGPIVKGKLFFFANYEGARTNVTSVNSLYKTLSAFARSRFVPSMQPLVDQLVPLPANCSAIPAPASCADPSPGSLGGNNPVTQGSNLVILTAALPTQTREDTGSIRLDYTISDSDRLMFRYNINDSLTNHTFGLNQGQVAPQALRTQLGKLDYTRTFSPTLLNEFGVGINRFYSDTNSNTPTPLVGFSGFFTDLGALPGPNSFNQITPFNVFEVFDSLTKIAGKHTLKFGTQIRVNRLNEWLRPQQTFQYGSFNDLFNNQPFVLSKIGFPGFVGIRNSNWHFYAQDNWQITSKLTLNLGLRYEYNTAWREGHDRMRNFDVATQTFTPAEDGIYNAPKSDFAPRVGFSYDPFGKGKTVIRGYGGLFYMPMQFGFNLTSNVPELASYSVNVFQAPIVFPMENPPLPAGTQNVTAFPQNPKDPYSTNWLFGIQQEIASNTVLTVNYLGNKTQHMQAGVSFASLNANVANVFTQARPFSDFANENVFDDVLSSKYNALQVQVRRNVGKLNLEANYTWSHETDNTVNVFSGFSNPMDPSADYATGDIDVRHNLTASAVYNLPELNGTGVLKRGVLGGWQLSSILQTRSGLPTNVSLVSGFFGNPIRPIAVPGHGMSADANWPDGNYNLAAFAVPPTYDGTPGIGGTIGRNALRGPGFFQWDFSASKSFPVGERVKLQFRADLFNILNHPNFANPDGGICTAVASATATAPADCALNANGERSINTNFGRSSQTIASAAGGLIGNGTARQAQFSLKLIF